MFISTKVTLVCLVCKRGFIVHRYMAGIRKFCSRQCFHTTQVGKPGPVGRNLSIDHKKKISQGNARRYLLNPQLKQSIALALQGAKSPLWRGGVSSANDLARNSFQYRRWREEVFQKDDYRCYDCGTRSGETGHTVHLEADHIHPFALFPRLRYIVDNGRTLCVECHKKTPTFGGGTLKLIQQKPKVVEYIESVI